MTDKDLDKLFKDKLGGESSYAYSEGAWERAQAQWTKSKSVDQLFKEGLANNTYAYNSSAWTKMERLIAAGERAVFFRRVAAAATVLLALTGGLYFFSTDGLQEESAALTEASPKKELNTNQTSNAENIESSNSKAFINEEESAEATSSDNIQSASLSIESKRGSNTVSESEQIFAENTTSKGIKEQIDEEVLAKKSTSKNEVVDANTTVDNNQQTELNELVASSEMNVEEKSFELNPSVEDEEILEDILLEGDPSQMDYAALPSIVVSRATSLPLSGNYSNKMNRSKWNLELNAGLNLATPYSNGVSEKGKTSALYLAGIGINREFNNRFSIESGVLYYSRLAQNTEISIQEIQYQFGSDVTNTTLTPRSLHYVGLPVMLNYSFYKKHTIGLGAQVAYLVDSRIKLTSTQSVNDEIVSESTTEGWGYTEGFERVDAALVVNYHYLMTDRLKLGISMNYGLVDVTPDEVYENIYEDRNIQFMVRLKYRVWNF